MSVYAREEYLGFRAIGAFTSPGVLSFYSVVGLTFGLFAYKQLPMLSNLFIIITSSILGVVSGNRSFFISAAIIIIIFIITNMKYKINGKLIMKSIIVILVLFSVGIILQKYYPDKFVFITNRFDKYLLIDDFQTRLTGRVGLVTGIKSLFENPLFGNVIFDDNTNTLLAKYKDNYSSVNNGFVSILAYNGVIIGLYYYYFYFQAMRRYWFRNKSFNFNNYPNGFMTTFPFMFFAASLVCLSDSFLTSPLMILILMPAFIIK